MRDLKPISNPSRVRPAGFSRRGAVAVAGSFIASSALAATDASLPDGITADQFETLATVLHDLFPHDRLTFEVYRNAMRASLAANRAQERIAALTAGISALEDGQVWRNLPQTQRVARLKSLAGTPFFVDLRMTAILALYHDQAVVSQFGYQGPSLDDGGYLERGFDDLTWLPDPPKADGAT